MKNNISLKKKKKVHFIGIGGIGMSGVASLLLDLGHEVSGSDLKDSELIARLKAKGADIHIGHRSSNLKKGTDLVVYTPCVKTSNPEILKAATKELSIPVVHRHDILSLLMRSKKPIVVTGAHGKGSTTALIGNILLEAGLDPTVIVGAEVTDFGGNARMGEGDYFVLEADESDGSFVKLEPYYGVITNIDTEHLEHYKNIENIIKTNRVFIDNIKHGGMLFIQEKGMYASGLLKGYKKKCGTFSFSKDADIYAEDIKTDILTTTFKCVYKGKELGVFKLALPGRHNVLNALAAISVAMKIGIEPLIIEKALSGFRGAQRRFEVKGRFNDVLVVEDYAHHPTEIEATLRVCRDWDKGRVISIFQPHRFSRTKLLADEFARAFALSDEVILTDVYSAHEDSLEGVSSRLILDKLNNRGMARACLIAKDKIVEYLKPRVMKDDCLLVLGAGDIGDISEGLLEMLKSKAGENEKIEETVKKRS